MRRVPVAICAVLCSWWGTAKAVIYDDAATKLTKEARWTQKLEPAPPRPVQYQEPPTILVDDWILGGWAYRPRRENDRAIASTHADRIDRAAALTRLGDFQAAKEVLESAKGVDGQRLNLAKATIDFLARRKRGENPSKRAFADLAPDADRIAFAGNVRSGAALKQFVDWASQAPVRPFQLEANSKDELIGLVRGVLATIYLHDLQDPDLTFALAAAYRELSAPFEEELALQRTADLLSTVPPRYKGLAATIGMATFEFRSSYTMLASLAEKRTQSDRDGRPRAKAFAQQIGLTYDDRESYPPRPATSEPAQSIPVVTRTDDALQMTDTVTLVIASGLTIGFFGYFAAMIARRRNEGF